MSRDTENQPRLALASWALTSTGQCDLCIHSGLHYRTEALSLGMQILHNGQGIWLRFCSAGGHYLCLLRLPAVQTFLKRSCKAKAASPVSLQGARE